MLIQSQKYGLKEARQKSFDVSQSFFAHYDTFGNEDQLLTFFRNQKFLEC